MGFLSDMRRTSASLQAITSLANAQHPVEQGGNNGESLPYHVPRRANISALGLFMQRQLSHSFANLFASSVQAPAMGEFVVDEFKSVASNFYKKRKSLDMLDWLNYHHLHYFWVVAKEGGITVAAEKLHLAQPTLSSQIQKLEKSMGVNLFDRVGRGLVLSETGQVVFRYADEIFSLGRELTETLQGRPTHDDIKLVVGVPDIVPKLIVYHLLKPALALEDKVHIVCYERKLQDLLSDLALHRLDIVLADSPSSPHLNLRAFNHLLGECGVSVLGTSVLAKRFKKDFPASLEGAPMLLPTQNTPLRRALEQWFDKQNIHPDVRHEFEDSAVLKVFGQAGEGLIVAPSATESDVAANYSLQLVGRIPEVTERYYAISVERRLKHPAVVAICNSARTELFPEENPI